MALHSSILSFIDQVSQRTTLHNGSNHAVERVAEHRAPHGGVSQDLKMKMRHLWIIAMIAALVGCDGYIAVKGKVYEWNNPPIDATSKVIVDKTGPLESLDIRPLASAKVTLFHGGDYSKTTLDEKTIWQKSKITDDEGNFNIGDVTAPGKFTAVLRVQKDGYQKIDSKFLHNKREHEAIILLIKEPNK